MSDPQRTIRGRARGQMRGTRGTRGGTRGGSTNSANTTNASAPSAPVNIPPCTTSTTVASTGTTTAPVPSSKFNIKWESGGIDRTFSLVAYLTAHRGDCRVLFSENKKKKNPPMQDDDSGLQPSSKEKGGIHAIIAEEIFAKDAHYGNYYRAYPQKFAVAVGNRLTFLKNKYRTQRSRFNQTSSGVDPSDTSAAANLREDVLRQLPTYDDLDELWRSIPSYAPKAFSSDHKADHAGHLLSIMHTKSAPASTATASSCPAPDDNAEFYDVNADVEVDGPDPSQDLPLTMINQQLPQSSLFAGDNDDDLNYDMLDGDVMDYDVNAGDSEMNPDGDEDYDMAAHETATSGENHVDKHPRPFSPSPPPKIIVSPMMAPHTPVSDSRASFAGHASHAISRTSLSHLRRPPPSVASSTISSSARSCPTSGSAPTPSPTSNTSVSTKAKSVKHVRSEITDVRDKMQLLAQGAVAERHTAKADQKILKLQIHGKERDQMFSLSQQLIQQSSSSLEHQRTIESKNANIRLEQAKAQTHASEIELLHLKLQLGEQQLQQKQKQSAESSSSPAS